MYSDIHNPDVLIRIISDYVKRIWLNDDQTNLRNGLVGKWFC